MNVDFEDKSGTLEGAVNSKTAAFILVKLMVNIEGALASQ